MPKVSVIMPCYNRAEYVAIAVESILNQTFSGFEFIIVDDASTDGSRAILESYANKDPRIVLIKNETNRGLCHNLNLGLDLSKGEYIARMDDDDIARPERFQKQVDFLVANSDVAVLGTYISLLTKKPALNWVQVADPAEVSVWLYLRNPMCHPTTMLRKSFLLTHNLKYAEKDNYVEDYELWAKVIIAGGKIANLPEALLEYRLHENRICARPETTKIQTETIKAVRRELFSVFFKDSPWELDYWLEEANDTLKRSTIARLLMARNKHVGFLSESALIKAIAHFENELAAWVRNSQKNACVQMSPSLIKDIWDRKPLFFYLKMFQILETISFGKIKHKFTEKCVEYDARLKRVRSFMLENNLN